MGHIRPEWSLGRPDRTVTLILEDASQDPPCVPGTVDGTEPCLDTLFRPLRARPWEVLARELGAVRDEQPLVIKQDSSNSAL